MLEELKKVWEQGAYQKALETARSFLSEGLEPQMVAWSPSEASSTLLIYINLS